MSTKELAISVWDKQTLLVKFFTVKEKFKIKSEQEVLSNDIYLPGYDNEPLNIGFMFKFHSSKRGQGDLIAFVKNCVLKPTDLEMYFYCGDDNGKLSGI